MRSLFKVGGYVLSSLLAMIVFWTLSLLAFSGLFSNKLPSGPIKHSRDITTSSLIESIDGLVT